MTRRIFAAILCAVILRLAIPGKWVRDVFIAFRKPAISQSTLKTFVLLAEHIYPGAQGMGIGNFISAQASLHYYSLKIETIERIAILLDKQAGKLGYRSFIFASETAREKLIQSLAAARNNPELSKYAQDFSITIDCVLEGCFSDPVHGGNHNRVGWTFMKAHLSEKWFYA